MSRQVDLGQIVPSIQVGTTTTGSPSSQASVINVGTDLNPILNFTIPKGEAGAIHMIIVQTLPTHDIDESAIYLLPLENPTEEGNNYAEYVYINNQWELLGKIGVHVDLTDYVKNTDYASSSKGGVFKIGYGTSINNSGIMYAQVRNYNDYSSNVPNELFISKGTLENVITGKGLVSNTDYASSSVGGVIKATGAYSFVVDGQGRPSANTLTYEQYNTYSENNFISKGTLENVITGKGLVSNTTFPTTTTGGVVINNSTYGASVNSSGIIYALSRTYEQYESLPVNYIISKGTLDNVLDAKIGDIQTLLDNLNTGSGV